MGNKIIRSVRDEMWESQASRCGYCGIFVAKMDATIDHMIPQSKKNRLIYTHKFNIIMACKKCNTLKANMMLETWVKWLEQTIDSHYIVAKQMNLTKKQRNVLFGDLIKYLRSALNGAKKKSSSLVISRQEKHKDENR